MNTLSNGEITLSIHEHGAELTSIQCDGREYLWGAYPEFWKRHSPVLFPIVGSVWNGEYRSQGRTFKMGQHGFARDMDFTLVRQEPDYIEFGLQSTAETLTKYPYPFDLRIGYRLRGRTIDVVWRVINPSDGEMAFQIGAHPAFYWPMLTNEEISAGVDTMNKALAVTDQRGYFQVDKHVTRLVRTLITEGGCVDRSMKQEVAVNDGFLPLDTELFAHDALVLEDNQIQAITLCDSNKRPYLTVEWDAPLVGLWSPPGKNAPFVCIEPWYGRADRAHYSGDYEDKDYTNKLAPHQTFEVKYSITLH